MSLIFNLARNVLRPGYGSEMAHKLADGAVVIFDDIQDNLHFRDWFKATAARFRVFEYEGKWIGVTGGPPSLYSPNDRAES